MQDVLEFAKKIFVSFADLKLQQQKTTDSEHMLQLENVEGICVFFFLLFVYMKQ